MSLPAGLDLVTGVVHARVEERHRSREFSHKPQSRRA
jgi:hypothetical protein